MMKKFNDNFSSKALKVTLILNIISQKIQGKMMRKISLFVLAFLFVACSSKTTMQSVNEVSNKQSCYSCEDAKAFEAKIKGLLYISDVGIRCCVDKRTLDKSVAIKKIYIHSISDLSEEQKTFYADKKQYLINEQFNATFYTFLKQELEARGMVVIKGINNSPYVLRLDFAFLSFSSNLDSTGLHSNVSGRLSLKDINTNKEIIVRTKQDIIGFKDLKDISFYTYLLLKQMANKTASIISAL